MPDEWLTYRTSDGSLYVDFVILYCGADIGWRIYIIDNINFHGRDTSSAATHRLKTSNETYHYVCWQGVIASYEEAKTVAALWADVIALYIKGNQSFDEIASQLCK